MLKTRDKTESLCVRDSTGYENNTSDVYCRKPGVEKHNPGNTHR
jgi:hypothetical protein